MDEVTDSKPLPSSKPSGKRGFAALSPERRREIAKMGGKAVPKEKRSFSTNKKLASDAGSRGGKAIPGHKRSFSNDPKLAAEAGAKGGRATWRRKKTQEKLDV